MTARWQFSLRQLFALVTICAVVMGLGVPFVVALRDTENVELSLALNGVGHAASLALISWLGWLPLRSSATQRTEAMAHGFALALVMFVLMECVPAAMRVFSEFSVNLSMPTIWLFVAAMVFVRWWILILPIALAVVFCESVVFGVLNSRPNFRPLAKAWSATITLSLVSFVLFSTWAIARCFFSCGGFGRTEFLF